MRSEEGRKMTIEIERLEQKWEEWKWAKTKDFIREEEFPEAMGLVVDRRYRAAVYPGGENDDIREGGLAHSEATYSSLPRRKDGPGSLPGGGSASMTM